MPLMKPEIQNILRKAGLAPASSDSDERSVSEKLDAAGLSLQETLDQLAYIAKESGNESLRARCLETALKAHGALKDTTPAPPSFTIVIQPSQGSPSVSSHPNLPQGVNPILLPRQLLSGLDAKQLSN